MADENGVVPVENEEDQTTEATAKLKQRIESLESENENLTAEIESLKLSKSESEQQAKYLEVVAKRASELETEVSRLQHDLVSAMSEGEEANNEVKELKKVIGIKEGEIEEIKKEKIEIEKKVRELERKIGVLEMKEIEERSKRVRIEEEMREKIDLKEKEIVQFKNKYLELENDLVQLKEASQENERSLLGKIKEAQEKLDETEILATKVKEINGIVGEFARSEEKIMDWPMIAGCSAGAVVFAAAVGYVCCVKRS
ncbi:peroxisomal and mitochondrial division factor 2-like [Mercurialis annua]|uniref:peroxisomal and mitochondrial division factor 2-like n=1 Tax=Mercurialis annua TaxID=3986 RepID=UPI00215F3291|nr:peroxisomal and mitochondrial division factor 2-like [Mercurialis annua]